MLFACEGYTFVEMITYVGACVAKKCLAGTGSIRSWPLRAWPFFGTRLNLPLIAGLDSWFGD